MKEIWKDIKNYEGYYQVSNLGNIKSLERTTALNGNGKRAEAEKTLKLKKHRDGYLITGLRKNGTRKWFIVHRLVAEAFIPKIDGKDKINHKNENKEDNNINNLEWCNTLYNNTYGTRIERVREKTSIPIEQYDKDDNYINSFSSISNAGRKTNTDISSICKCINGKQSNANGFIWKKRGDVL